MKQIYFMMLFLALFITIGCKKEYTGEYIQWGDSLETVDTDKLDSSDIPYKIENGKVYVPEDAFDKAILCCS
ncbi:hypothetical protein [Metabacillus niabensis]|nr:hypothetical protein [Metabacillus niabensis]